MYSCLSGGLGNQMFQYAAAYILKQYFQSTTLVLDDSYYYSQPKRDTVRSLELNQFNISYDRFSFADEKEKIKLLRKFKRNPFPKQISEILSIALFGKYALSDRAFYTFETIKNIDKACLFSFYQDADLLNKHKQLILPLFELRDDLLDICKNLELYSLIQRSNNTTALHIRRGDYVTNQHAAKYHGVLDISYYNHAMEYVERERGKQNFIIFSDDVRWAQKAFLENDNCYVINNSDYDFSAIDMYLMSLCKNNIIANSTYSWWGAWLNKYEDKLVISPKQWFLGNNETSLRNASWITL